MTQSRFYSNTVIHSSSIICYQGMELRLGLYLVGEDLIHPSNWFRDNISVIGLAICHPGSINYRRHVLSPCGLYSLYQAGFMLSISSSLSCSHILVLVLLICYHLSPFTLISHTGIRSHWQSPGTHIQVLWRCWSSSSLSTLAPPTAARPQRALTGPILCN